MLGNEISHYRILDKLGEGGMGVVYKAEDTKLERTVALKFLSSTAIAGEEEKKRFKREAKAAAALNHPNIAHIYAIDEEDGKLFIAMEFIEGKSLSQIILGDGHARPLALDDAVNYATQISAGLQAAHEKGIVHRDIKSANVMVTDKGVVKIMDFGLASLTGGSKVTQLGTTLGTAAYMPPEQARGEQVDHRADIWALGVVLYEMISGQLPFKGDYEQAVIYSILNEDPEPLTALRTGVPVALDGIVAKALAKDRATRYQHVDELPADLKALDMASLGKSRITAATQPPAGSKPAGGSWLPWAIAAGLGIGWLGTQLLKTTEPALPLTAALVFEEGTGPAVSTGRNLALSPDGTQLAYFTSGPVDGGRLWIRDLADGSTRPLEGTRGADRPFWSPDGSMLGYFAREELRVVPAKGGPSIRLASAPRPSGGTWNAEGIILYNPTGRALFQIPAAGGTPAQVTQPMREAEDHRGPDFLPDGKHFLFWAIDFSKGRGNVQNIYKGDLDTGQFEQIREGASPAYVASGFLVFRIGGSLFAQQFDPERSALSGQPLPISSGLRGGPDSPMSVADRTIVYASGMGDSQGIPILMNRKGNFVDSLAHRRSVHQQRFSHDGSRVAFAAGRLWVHDLSRNISERIPTEVTWPRPFAWSPDDSSIVYSAFRVSGQLRVVQVAGAAKEEAILQSDAGNIDFIEWSPDGRTILIVYLPDETRPHRELWACDVKKGTASPLLKGSFNVFNARFAPGGEWYAFTSDEGGGDSDVYLRSFPGPGAQIRVTAGGGAWPTWRRDGKELFYLNGEGHLVVVQVAFKGGRPSVSPAEIITANPITSNPNSRFPSFDVHPDGQRYLLYRGRETRDDSQLIILRNWVEILEEK